MKAILDDATLTRIKHPATGEYGDPYNGAALMIVQGVRLLVLFSNGEGWEHVSVSHPARCPTWEEMCVVKDRFFDPEDCVVQYHPPRSKYVSLHPYCLHLWRPLNETMPQPEPWMVG